MNPGDHVTEHLRLVRKLGEGGMGSVWVADHLKLETQVAVKFVNPAMLNNPEVRARFQREATSAAKIHSPHVVRTLDHGVTTQGVPYIAMELLSGQDLGALIEERGALPPPFIRTVLTQACKGLGKAHELGIVHRDITPENIFISDEGGDPFVRLLDFGVAKQTLSNELGLTSSGTMMGTPYYMSPEQAMSAKQVDFRSDLWSLGAVMYHALTDRRPFEAETLGALCVKLDRAQFEPATQVRGDLPPSLDAWFRKALAREPTERFGSAKEMSDAFALAIGAPVSGRYSSLPPATQASKRRATKKSAALPPDTMAQAAAVLQQSLKRRPSILTWVIIGVVVLGVVAAVSLGLRRAHAPTTAAHSAPNEVGSAPAVPSQGPPPSIQASAATPVGPPSAQHAAANVVNAASAAGLAPLPSMVGVPAAETRGAPKLASGNRSQPARANAGQPRPNAPALHQENAKVPAPAGTAVPTSAVNRAAKKDRGF